MKRKHPLLLSLTLALACLFATIAQAAPGDEPETELGKDMDSINKAFRTIRKQASDPSKSEENAALVAKMIEAAEAAAEEIPAYTADQPESEKEAFIEGYRKEMKVAIDQLKELHQAYLAGNVAEAESLIGEIRDHQKQSHREYKKPDEKH